MPHDAKLPNNRYQWAALGDVNAFFGLMLDNIAGLVLMVSLLAGVFGFPTIFVITYMVPGTAIGVLVGDLLLTKMAFSLARTTGRKCITAMPLGLDTPSTFGMVFFVLGPAFLDGKARFGEEQAPYYAWQIGICAIFISGLFKFACAFGSGWVRRVVPRAGLLGSLAAIALVLISFLPLVEIAHAPVAGFAALAVILTTLVARQRLPGRFPGALAALLIGGVIYYAMQGTGSFASLSGGSSQVVWMPTAWLSVFHFQWTAMLGESIQYLPIVIPFALATVVGGIDCTESAAAGGDEYHTGKVIATEAFATLIAAVCGGVIQTTPYIGHPAYKAMGGRAAYTLATGLFIGSAGVFGFFSILYEIIPKVAVYPILVFIGLEITAQSFHATVKRHYPAVVFACIPALAYLVMIHADRLLAVIETNTPLPAVSGDDPAGQRKEDPKDLKKLALFDERLASDLQTIRILSAGFIVTSLLWASVLCSMIDRRFDLAAIYFATAALASLFGVIHSPLPGGKMLLPWDWDRSTFPDAASGQTPVMIATAYLVAALLMLVVRFISPADENLPTKEEGPSDAIESA